jgi:hypothetical protein
MKKRAKVKSAIVQKSRRTKEQKSKGAGKTP